MATDAIIRRSEKRTLIILCTIVSVVILYLLYGLFIDYRESFYFMIKLLVLANIIPVVIASVTWVVRKVVKEL